jgi:A/G-specific adenine glycosylase
VELHQGDLQQFADQIVGWQKLHGRHDLPWQNTRDPYRVWLSEVMLQQTQVSTVLGYFDRFLKQFPAVSNLAEAPLDEVLGLWSGLGYYSRARNMHKCAQQIVSVHGGEFPRSAELLQKLPGIGPSTAAAIASFCYSERVAILDGNVKRVLTRVLAFEKDLSESINERALRTIAATLPPKNNLIEAMPRYTQGMMDLGATVCARRKPKCLICPVQTLCKSLLAGNPENYPLKTRKLKRSSLKLWLLWVQTEDGLVWLTKRPDNGIWGGLYCLPVFDTEEALRGVASRSKQRQTLSLPDVKHVLTHKDLILSPVLVEVCNTEKSSFESLDPAGKWFARSDYIKLGLPAPVRKLLEKYMP